MALTCNAAALVSAAKCFPCIPHSMRGPVESYLLAVAASQPTDKAGVAAIVAAASCLECIPNSMRDPVELYLYALAAGLPTDKAGVASAVAAASAFRAIPHGMIDPVDLYELAVATSSSTDPATLTAAAKCFSCEPDVIRKVANIYLLATATSVTVSASSLVAGAKCFSCVPTQERERLKTYLLCQVAINGIGSGQNLIPSDAVCQAGSYTLSGLKANQRYQIQWGNETAVTICGTTYNSPGIGLFTIVDMGACTTMVFACGVGAITTRVTPTNKNTLPTNFLWQIDTNGANVTATWDTPPGFVTSTELWVSTNGTSFSKVATIAAPGTSSSVVSPIVGAVKYAKIRFNNGGPFTAAQVAWGQVANWAARVIVNGGAAMSHTTINARNTFWDTLVSGSLNASMVAMNTYATDNLIASITPLVVGVGNDPWTNSNFVLADLTVDGLKGDGASKALNTGINPSTAFANDTSFGISIYTHDGNTAAAVTGTVGCANAAFNNCAALKLSQANVTYFECWDVTGVHGSGFLNATENNFQGFTSGSRTAANAMGLYHANSVTPFAAIDTGAGTGGTRPNGNMLAHDLNVIGSGNQFDPQRISFVAIHLGYSSAQTQVLYNAVQAMLVAQGGGFV